MVKALASKKHPKQTGKQPDRNMSNESSITPGKDLKVGIHFGSVTHTLLQGNVKVEHPLVKNPRPRPHIEAKPSMYETRNV